MIRSEACHTSFPIAFCCLNFLNTILLSRLYSCLLQNCAGGMSAYVCVYMYVYILHMLSYQKVCDHVSENKNYLQVKDLVRCSGSHIVVD